MADVRVIGLGNTLAGDDGVGIAAVRRLKTVAGLAAEVVEAERTGVDVLELLRGPEAVVLVDAVRGGRPPGAVLRLDVSATPLPPSLFPRSTHGLTAVDGVELGRALGVLPPVVIVYGVQIASLARGAGLSPAVAGALPALTARVAREVAALRHA